MKKLLLAFVVAGFAVPVHANAQSNATAMEIAQGQNACGDASIVSARFLDDGRVGVRCSSGAAAASCVAFAAAADGENDLRALRIAEAQNACGDRNIVSARFGNDNEVRVQCTAAVAAGGGLCPAGTVLVGGATALAGVGAGTAVGAGVATGFVPIAAGTLLTAVLGAAAIGNNSSTSDTQ